MKNKLTTILLILALFAGLSLLLYPTVSDYWNSLHASQAVADYAENVRNLEAEKYEQVLQDAKSYKPDAALRANYICTFGGGKRGIRCAP